MSSLSEYLLRNIFFVKSVGLFSSIAVVEMYPKIIATVLLEKFFQLPKIFFILHCTRNAVCVFEEIRNDNDFH